MQYKPIFKIGGSFLLLVNYYHMYIPILELFYSYYIERILLGVNLLVILLILYYLFSGSQFSFLPLVGMKLGQNKI